MNIKRINTIRIELEDDYYIDITPSTHEDGAYDTWMHRKGYGDAVYMYSVNCSDEEAIDMAISNAPDYFGEFEEDEI